MSNSPSHDEPGPVHACAALFARLADVPVDAVDKLIETSEAVYTDLNQVAGHPYWGDLVYQQGAAVRALKEARAALDAFRAEAIGARNTELGITVATAVIDGERQYAHTRDDKAELVDKVLRPSVARSACHLYVWDRPYDNVEFPGPYTQIRVVTEAEEQLGVLNFTEETEEGDLHSWHTVNPQPIAGAPVLKFDKGSALAFPRDCVLPWDHLRQALIEFAEDGQRPQAVQWQDARWGE